MRDAILSLVESEREYDIPIFTLFPLKTSSQDFGEQKAELRTHLIIKVRKGLSKFWLFISC
jgi:hypothetical protein